MEPTATQPTGPGDTLDLYLMWLFGLRVDGNFPWIWKTDTPIREISGHDFEQQVLEYYEHLRTHVERALVDYHPNADGDWKIYAYNSIELHVVGFDTLYEQTEKRLRDFFEIRRIMGEPPTEFRDKLQHLINFHGLESGSDTPDHVLADYLVGCLDVFDKTMLAREHWYGRELSKNETINLDDPREAPANV